MNFAGDNRWLAPLIGALDRGIDTNKCLPVKEWLESDYHLGVLRNFIYPFWKQRLVEFFENRSTYYEAVVTGAIRTGKTKFALFAWLRFLYELSAMDDPQETFGLMPGSEIYLAYLSLTLKQAEQTGFGDLRTMVDSIPYFQREFPRNKDIDSTLEFPKHIRVICGSEGLHLLGAAVISIILDEANFLKEGGAGKPGDLDKAVMICELARNRISGQFVTKSGSFPGLMLWVSSSSHQSSFTQKVIADNSPHTMIVSGSIWDVKPDRYSDLKFMFYCGSDEKNPQVIETHDDWRNLFGIKCLPSDASSTLINMVPPEHRNRIIEVPVNFLDRFKSNPMGSMADLAGVSITPTGRLFTSKPNFNACVDRGLSHPFTQESLTLSLSDDTRITDYIRAAEVFQIVGGKPGLKRLPSEPRYIHVDLGVTGDAAAIACFHLEGIVETPAGQLPLAVCDFMLRLPCPPPPDRLPLDKVTDFIMALRDAGMSIGVVTFDQFQSEQSRQTLTRHGIRAELKSVDRSDEFHTAVSNHIYCGAVRFYEYAPLRREWFDLIHDRKSRKVDHPKDGTKDVADAFVGAVSNCLEAGRLVSESVQSLSSLSELLEKQRQRKEGPVADAIKGFFPGVEGIVQGGRHIRLEKLARLYQNPKRPR